MKRFTVRYLHTRGERDLDAATSCAPIPASHLEQLIARSDLGPRVLVPYSGKLYDGDIAGVAPSDLPAMEYAHQARPVIACAVGDGFYVPPDWLPAKVVKVED